jgi:hypothetical protein
MLPASPIWSIGHLPHTATELCIKRSTDEKSVPEIRHTAVKYFTPHVFIELYGYSTIGESLFENTVHNNYGALFSKHGSFLIDYI